MTALCLSVFSINSKETTVPSQLSPTIKGLPHFLKITGLASELAARIGINGLERVPGPGRLIAAPPNTGYPGRKINRLENTASQRDICSRTANDISGAAGRNFLNDDARHHTPIDKKRKSPSSREDWDNHQDRQGKQVDKQRTQYTEHTEMARDHHVEAMSSAPRRTLIPNVLSAWNLANHEDWRVNLDYNEDLPAERPRITFAETESSTSSINKVSAWRSATFPRDSRREHSCPQLQQRQQIMIDHHATEIAEVHGDVAAREVRPWDSVTFCNGSSWSTTWSEQFRDKKSITPSRLVGVLRQLGYGLSIISTASMDRLLPVHFASRDGHTGTE